MKYSGKYAVMGCLSLDVAGRPDGTSLYGTGYWSPLITDSRIKVGRGNIHFEFLKKIR